MKRQVYIIQQYGPPHEAVDHHGDSYGYRPLISASRVTREIYETSNGREDVIGNYHYKRIQTY